MSSSPTSPKPRGSRRFWLVAVITLVLAVGVGEWWASAVVSYAHRRAVTLADLSANKQINPEIGYRAALVLDPGNSSYQVALANAYLASWNAQAAIDLVPDNDASNSELAVVRSKALVETGNPREAAKIKGGSEAVLYQRGLALAADGDTALAAGIAQKLPSEQLRAQLQRATSNQLALAQELAAAGMPKAALAICQKQARTSVAQVVLEVKLLMANPRIGESDLKLAAEAVGAGLAMEPSSHTLWELKRQVAEAQGDSAGANQAADKLQRLQQGTY